MNAVLAKIFCAQRILKNAPAEGEMPDDETLLRRAFRVAWPVSYTHLTLPTN